MPQAMIDLYNSLSEVKQQEVYDFMTYLSMRENKKTVEQVESLLQEANNFAEQNGLQDITLDEINDEIALCRAGK